MARPTKRDVAMAERLHDPDLASRIAGLREQGLSAGDDAEGWRALLPLTGPGRDNDVAAVKLAAAGWPTRRLRTVIGKPNAKRAQAAFETILGVVQRAASSVVMGGMPEQAARLPETPAEQAAVAVDTTLLDYDDALSGRAEEASFEDARRLSGQLAIDLGGPAEPGAAVYTDEFAALMTLMASRLRTVRTWSETASDDDLVLAVKASADVWHATVARRLPLGDEDTWRFIAALAPVASLFVALAREVQSQVAKRPSAPDGGSEGPDP